MNKVYEDDVGTEISIETGADLTAASVLRILVQRPNGTHVTWSATLDGTTAMKYVVKAGDLDLPGTYKLQGYVEIGSFKGRCATVNLVVFPKFG